MIVVSYVLVILNPVSAIMLTAIVVALRRRLRMGVCVRFCAALLACSLIVHAVEQVDMIRAYRPPRAYTWLVVYAAMHALIWSAFWRTYVRPI